MKKQLLLGTIICLFAVNAYSMDIRPYIEGRFSESSLREKLMDHYMTLSLKENWLMGASVEAGGKIDQFRLGLEAYYNDKGKDDAYNTDMEFRTKGVFLNAYYDIPMPSENLKQIKPYIGGGIGYSNLKITLKYDDDHPWDRLTVKDNDWSWNVGLGVGYTLNENVDLTLGYRYEDLGQIKYHGAKIKYRNNKVALGLRYTF